MLSISLLISIGLLSLEQMPTNEDAFYLKACSLCQLQNYHEAYMVLKEMTSKIETPRDDAIQLNGFIIAKLTPPLYQEGVNGFDYLINKHRRDFHSVYIS